MRETDFSFIFSLPDAISKWVAFKDTLDKVINLVAPKKKIKIKDKENIFPWNDLELSILKNQRNLFYAHYIKTKSEESYNSYMDFKARFQKIERVKMIEYFSHKTMKDFKTNKDHWAFYKTHVKMKSDKDSSIPLNFEFEGKTTFDNKSTAAAFNKFFSSFKSDSNETTESCGNFIQTNFKNLSDNAENYTFNCFKKLKLNGKLFTRSFSFQHVSELTVLQFLGDINTDSAPGVSDISIKIVKKAIPYLISILTHILNSMITNSIPLEYKCAIITPLYKS